MKVLDDIALFAAVARGGSLAAAARSTGASVPTLSRRMTALEAAMGRRLFLHGKGGYALTVDGRALLDRAEALETAAAAIARWRDARDGPARVRISAGAWTALHLARSLPAHWRPGDDWVPEFVASERELDIARREVDIGVRNRRPDHPWLAARRVRRVDFAVYARDASVEGWIGASAHAVETPSLAWMRAQPGPVVVSANDRHVALALARAGAGRIVLPTFVGDRAEGLARLTPDIPELVHDAWLVCHHEGRHDPPVRKALDTLGRMLEG